MELNCCSYVALVCLAIFSTECSAIPLAAAPSECGTCDPSLCNTAPTQCPLGTVLDGCNCCEVCARALGDTCGQSLGACGEGLICTADSAAEPLTGTCQERTCLYEDTVLRYGDRIFLNQCSVCECTNDGLSCTSQTCPQIECINNQRRITPSGACCPVCVEFESYYATQPGDVEATEAAEITSDLAPLDTEVTEVITESTEPTSETSSFETATASTPQVEPPIACTQQGSFRNPQDACETCRCVRGVQLCQRLEFLCPVGVPLDATQATEVAETPQATEVTETIESTPTILDEASEATTAPPTPVEDPTFACTEVGDYRNPQNPCEICRCNRGVEVCVYASYLCPVGIPFEATEPTEESTQTTASPTPVEDPTFACTELRPFRNSQNPCEICRCDRGFQVCVRVDYLCPINEPLTTAETEATSPTVIRSATNNVFTPLVTVEVVLILSMPLTDYITDPSSIINVLSEVLEFQGADISSIEASTYSSTETRLSLVVKVPANLLLDTLEATMSEELQSTLVSVHISELAPTTSTTADLDVQREAHGLMLFVPAISMAVVCGVVVGLVLTALCLLRKRRHQAVELPKKLETV